MNTATESVVVDSGDTVPPPAYEPRRHRWLWWAVPLLLIVILLGTSTFVTLPYFEMAPGQAIDVYGRIQVPKDDSYPPKGTLMLLTVTLARARPLDAVRGWLDKDIAVVPEKEIYGPVKPANFEQIAVQDMVDSKTTAILVALRRIGSPVTEHGDGALIQNVAPKAPADGKLRAGDVITALNGKPVHIKTELLELLAPHKFGETIALTVTTQGQPARTENIKLGGNNADKTHCDATQAQTGAGCLGVAISTKTPTFVGPLYNGITINTGSIGGPSAGLAFTLGLLDELKPGDLTGGHRVAVTGTIDNNGNVGDVGGVVQKTATARRAGAEVFLVPPGEYKEAKAHAGPHLQVIVVHTLEEALAALARVGGDVAPLGPAPAAAR